ncbi:MAG: Ku protein [Planctomycetaceae bacterium]|nr:Ku protein [Planctomycetaceae bacterium]
MARSSSWKGYLRVSLVSVPVRAYTASQSGGGGISFNQLHEPCKSRISYKKECPIHGEVPNDEIVSGYQFAKGQYVVVDPDEIQQLRPQSEDRSIAVDTFVPAGSIDSLYHSGKTYYLTPDEPVGQKPYQLLRAAMAEQGLQAIAQVILTKKEQLVLVRPLGKLLVMSVLDYASHVKAPESFEDEITDSAVGKQELNLAKRLVGDMTRDDLDLSEYKDLYTERVTELVQAKVEGKEIVAPPAEEEPAVINLMDALKKSVAHVKKPAAKKTKASRPAPKAAASRTKRTTKKAAGGRKKTG